MKLLPYVGPSAPDALRFLSSQRTVNYLGVRDQFNRKQFSMEHTPGFSFIRTLPGGEVRKLLPLDDGRMYAVSGGVVGRLNKNLGYESIGAITTRYGPVAAAGLNGKMMVCDGAQPHAWDGSSFRAVTDSSIAGVNPDSVVTHDQYFIINEPGTGRFYIALLDPFAWDATDVATAEFKSDNLVHIETDRELWLFGETTIEPHANTGNVNFPFEVMRSGRMVFGLAAKHSVAKVDNTLYWLAQDENGDPFIARAKGFVPAAVSPQSWNKVFATYDYQDARAFSMTWQGHFLYVVTFPLAEHGGGRTLIYDSTTDWITEWGPYSPALGNFVKVPVTAHAKFNRKHYVGTADGSLYELTDDSYSFGDDSFAEQLYGTAVPGVAIPGLAIPGLTEDVTLPGRRIRGLPMISYRRGPVFDADQELLELSQLRFGVETGSGGELMMRASPDGGAHWSKHRHISMGAKGQYEFPVTANRLGASRSFVVESAISDAVPRRMVGVYAE